MWTSRFNFNFKPLRISYSTSPVGSVPTRQSYDASTGEFMPDFTLTPLVIQPDVGRIDPEGILTDGSANADLANVKWYEVTADSATADPSTTGKLIESTNKDYEVVTSGTNAGRITVKKNAQPDKPLTLRFYAELVDTRTGEIYKVQDTVMVRCDNASDVPPTLLLDAAPQTVYNPMRDDNYQTINATLMTGKGKAADANRLFVWEVMRSSGKWETVGTDELADAGLTVSTDGTSCTLKRALIGNQVDLRCRAKYDEGGNPSAVQLTDSSPCAMVSVVRRVPKYMPIVSGVPDSIPSGTEYLYPTLHVADAKGNTNNAKGVLLPLWYVATNKVSGSLTYTLIDHGFSPRLSTKAMSKSYGGVYGVDLKDVGPLGALADKDGAVITDKDGAVILIH